MSEKKTGLPLYDRLVGYDESGKSLSRGDRLFGFNDKKKNKKWEGIYMIVGVSCLVVFTIVVLGVTELEKRGILQKLFYE